MVRVRVAVHGTAIWPTVTVGANVVTARLAAPGVVTSRNCGANGDKVSAWVVGVTCSFRTGAKVTNDNETVEGVKTSLS